MATVAAVKQRVGGLLGRTRIGDALSEPLTSRITAGYNEVVDELKDDNLVVWNTSSGTIPNKVVPHLVALIAFNCCDEVGVSQSRYNRIVALNNRALPQIRKYVRDEYRNYEGVSDY